MAANPSGTGHTPIDRPAPLLVRYGTLTGENETGVVITDAGGTMNMFVGPLSGLFDLTVAAYGIDINEFTGAHIHLGPPGVDGPVIFDLHHPGNSFIDADGLGVVRSVFDQQFPMQHLGDLLAGNTYFNLHTTQYPDGEIRGQLLAIPSLNGDLNADGFVGQDDLNLVLAKWGKSCQPATQPIPAAMASSVRMT